MKNSKFGLFILLGAVGGGLASFLHKPTRESVIKKSKNTWSTIQYYSENKEHLKLKMQYETEKYKDLFENITEDAMFIKDKLEDFKTLTPQVKELIDQTKVALHESKEEIQSIVEDSNNQTTL